MRCWVWVSNNLQGARRPTIASSSSRPVGRPQGFFSLFFITCFSPLCVQRMFPRKTGEKTFLPMRRVSEGVWRWPSACSATALPVRRTRVNAHHFTRTVVRAAAAGEEIMEEPRVLHEADDWMVLNKVSCLQWLSALAGTASTDTHMLTSAACRLA